MTWTVKACRSVECYKRLCRLEEGTYGVVYKARDRDTGDIVALKRLKLEQEREGFPVTSLREINALMHVRHPHVVAIREVVMGDHHDVYIVMDFIENDLRTLVDNLKEPFALSEVKTMVKQLLEAVHAMHEQWIVHRDLKTSNLLLSNRGEIKVADFGLARRLGSPAVGKLTPTVVTLWYRAPEVLLGDDIYGFPLDLWSVGCIFAELLMGEPLFPAKTEIDMLDRIFRLLGFPSEQEWPDFKRKPHANKIKTHPYYVNMLDDKFRDLLSPLGRDLLSRLLCFDPSRRITPEIALAHPFFREHPLPKDPSLFPTWPSHTSNSQ